ncbi:MAG: hypothetical protein N4A76_07275 [Firmicutes bacterium]|nr:hypothetical protein [Bacillota bacterium]
MVNNRTVMKMKNGIVNNKGRVTLEAIIIVPTLMIFLLLFLNFSLRVYNKSMGVLLIEDRTRLAAMESYWNDGKQLVNVLKSGESYLEDGLEILTKGINTESVEINYSSDLMSSSLRSRANLKIVSDMLGKSSKMNLESDMEIIRPLQELDRIMMIKYVIEKFL